MNVYLHGKKTLHDFEKYVKLRKHLIKDNVKTAGEKLKIIQEKNANRKYTLYKFKGANLKLTGESVD